MFGISISYSLRSFTFDAICNYFLHGFYVVDSCLHCFVVADSCFYCLPMVNSSLYCSQVYDYIININQIWNRNRGMILTQQICIESTYKKCNFAWKYEQIIIFNKKWHGISFCANNYSVQSCNEGFSILKAIKNESKLRFCWSPPTPLCYIKLYSNLIKSNELHPIKWFYILYLTSHSLTYSIDRRVKKCVFCANR